MSAEPAGGNAASDRATPASTGRALTVRQPWADLILAGAKDVENRTWPVPSTLPQWRKCLAADGARDMVDDPEWPVRGCCRLDGPFPFRLGVHAAAQVDRSAPPSAWASLPGGLGRLSDRYGALLGFVTVTGCHPTDGRSCYEDGHDGGQCSPWAQPGTGMWHWTLADPEPLDVPVPMKGRLGLWKLDGAEVSS